MTLLAREPGPAISRVLMPLGFIVVLHPLYTQALASRGTAQAVAGVLVMFSILGMSTIGAGILAERTWHTADRLRASSVSPMVLLCGKAAPGLTLLAVQETVLLGFGSVVFGLRIASLGLVVVAGAVWSIAVLACGAALAMSVRSQAELSAATDLGGLVMTSIGGALVPLSTMPSWVRVIAPISPGYWGMRALSSAMDGSTVGTLRAAGVLAGVAAVATAVGAVRLRRGWGRSRLL